LLVVSTESIVIVREPLALPVAGGAKETLQLTLWPGDSVTGSVSSLTTKVLPAAVTCEMVRLLLPEFVTNADVLTLVIDEVPCSRRNGLAMGSTHGLN
jgi:hypothetical protein